MPAGDGAKGHARVYHLTAPDGDAGRAWAAALASWHAVAGIVWRCSPLRLALFRVGHGSRSSLVCVVKIYSDRAVLSRDVRVGV